MAMMRDLALQGAQMLLVLVLAPLLLGFTRKVKARLLRRRGPPVLQPYRDLLRLIRKEAVIADNASWLFRSGPYMIFAATWVAAALVPTFATRLQFSWTADLIAIAALIGSARFFLALAGAQLHDVRFAHLQFGCVLDDDEAIAVYREVVHLKLQNEDLHHNLGILYEKKGLLDEAVVEYKQALQHGENVDVRHRLITIYTPTAKDLRFLLRRCGSRASSTPPCTGTCPR
jgi:formate hydrogenlyase subunit 4